MMFPSPPMWGAFFNPFWILIMKCEFCGRKNENNPSDYYHRKGCEANQVWKMIRDGKYANEAELKKLKGRLETARYVGD